jgi:hypothetical protein
VSGSDALYQGQDFSRAVEAQQNPGFSPWFFLAPRMGISGKIRHSRAEADFFPFFTARLKRLRKKSLHGEIPALSG